MAKKRNYNKGQLGKHHPIQQTKFDTTNHVGRSWTKGQIPNGYGARTKDVKTKVCPQEKSILEGIANSLQCTEGEALRIMLHEFSRRITDGTITSLYHSKKVSASQQANDWLKEARATDKPKGTSMEAVKAASEQARMEAEDRCDQEYQERGEYMEMLKAQGLMHIYLNEAGEVDAGAIDHTRAREADAENAEVYGKEGDQTEEHFIAEQKAYGATPLEALEEWEEELARRKFIEEYDSSQDSFLADLPLVDNTESDIDYWGPCNEIS